MAGNLPAQQLDGTVEDPVVVRFRYAILAVIGKPNHTCILNGRPEQRMGLQRHSLHFAPGPDAVGNRIDLFLTEIGQPRMRRTEVWEVSADRWLKRERTEQPATFSAVFVAGQKRYPIWPSGNPVWRPFGGITPTRPKSILFGHARIMIRRFAGASRGSSTASNQRDWPRFSVHAAVTLSDSRMSWRRTTGRCGSAT